MSEIHVYGVDFMNSSHEFINFIYKNYQLIGVEVVCPTVKQDNLYLSLAKSHTRCAHHEE